MNTKWVSIAALVFNIIVLVAVIASTADTFSDITLVQETISYNAAKRLVGEINSCFIYGEFRPDWKGLFEDNSFEYLFADVIYTATEKVWESEGKFWVEKTDDNFIRICPIIDNTNMLF